MSDARADQSGAGTTDLNLPDYPWLNSVPSDIDWHSTVDPKPLYEILDSAVGRFPDNVCTYFLGRTQTYAEIATAVQHTAAGLEKLGVTKGTHVGLLLPNCPSYVIYYFAVLKLGATVVNFNPLYTAEELKTQAIDSEISIMVTLNLDLLFTKVESLLQSAAVGKAIVCDFPKLLPQPKSTLFKLFKRKDLAKIKKSPVRNKIVFDRTIQDNDGQYSQPDINPTEDIAVLQYTGGTTGVPKGVMLTHANLYCNTFQVTAWAAELEDGKQKVMAVLPFFHVFGMTVVMNFAIARASQIVLIPKFELDDALKLIDKVKPTCMPGVPTLFNAIANHSDLKKYDLSSLLFCFSGAAPLPLSLKNQFEELTLCKLVEGYGLSEAAPVVSCNPLPGPVKDKSIGLPMPGTKISLRDVEDPTVEVQPGERGELCISGPQVMKGYWKNQEATDGIFVGDYLRTGDVATLDGDGFIYIVDRIKDIILCSGYNVYPRQIEDAIYKHSAVEEVTAVAVPDEYRGEAPKAFVKLHDGHSLSEDELMAFLKTKLSKIEMPREIEFRDELPKTFVGKPSKKELQQQEAEARAEATDQDNTRSEEPTEATEETTTETPGEASTDASTGTATDAPVETTAGSGSTEGGLSPADTPTVDDTSGI